MKNAFKEFLQYKKLCALSEKSIKDYMDFISPFVGRYVYMTPRELRQDDINEYIGYLLEKQITRSTLSTYIRNVKIYLKWLSLEYDVQYDYTKIKVPKMPKKSVRVYSDAEIEMLFDSVNSSAGWLTCRNKAIISLMLDSGLRQGEIVGLLNANMMYDDMRIIVIGKGSKSRIVPLGIETRRLIEDYLDICPYKSEYLFVSRHGDKMTTDSVKRWVYRLSKKTDLSVSSHKLRHNFATNYCLDMYEYHGQIDIYKLMYLMGHEDIDTTRRYLHIATEMIAADNCISHVDKVFKKAVGF